MALLWYPKARRTAIVKYEEDTSLNGVNCAQIEDLLNRLVVKDGSCHRVM